MKALRKTLAAIRKADEHFDLINEGETIVVGVSGGKDSVLLVYALNLYKRFVNKNFNLIAVTLDLGFEGFDPAKLIEFYEQNEITYYIEDAKSVYPILKANMEQHKLNHLPCSICSKMKKAAINKAAHKYEASKVAFAHHGDDAVETLLMNAIHGGRIATFAPKMFLDREQIMFIRPFVYLDELTISQAVKTLELQLLESSCPADKKTTREDIKHLLQSIYKKYPQAQSNFILSLSNGAKYDVWDDKITYQTSVPYLTVAPVANINDKSAVIYIRMKVFCEEQQIALDDELTSDEAEYNYLLIKYKDENVGTIRYKVENNTAYFGRFAILKQYRGRGFGKAVFLWLEHFLSKKHSPLTITFSGQSYLKDYYLSLGYEIEGDIFYDANIEHYQFKKVIK